MSGKKQTENGDSKPRADVDLLRRIRLQWAHGTPADQAAELYGLDPDAVLLAYDELEAAVQDTIPDYYRIIRKQLIGLQTRRAALLAAIEWISRGLPRHDSAEYRELKPQQKSQAERTIKRVSGLHRDLTVIDREIRGLLEKAKPPGEGEGRGANQANVQLNFYPEKGDRPETSSGAPAEEDEEDEGE